MTQLRIFQDQGRSSYENLLPLNLQASGAAAWCWPGPIGMFGADHRHKHRLKNAVDDFSRSHSRSPTPSKCMAADSLFTALKDARKDTSPTKDLDACLDESQSEMVRDAFEAQFSSSGKSLDSPTHVQFRTSMPRRGRAAPSSSALERFLGSPKKKKKEVRGLNSLGEASLGAERGAHGDKRLHDRSIMKRITERGLSDRSVEPPL